MSAQRGDWMSPFPPFGTTVPCPDGPHRGPQGPNEDLAQCHTCWSVNYALRPDGETYGDHLPDCSLPLRHGGYCVPGGTGHPPSEHVRGYWPEDGAR